MWPATPEPERAPSIGIAAAPTNARIAAPAAARPAKVVYRNSVLPGGVGSAVELRSALAHDPVAAAHYAGFNVAAARKVQVERSRMAHVSYRIGDKIYWTKKPVRLALGESLLSDGEHLVRARCGNRISDQSQAPVFANEPAPEVLEMAFVSAESLIDAPSDAAPRAHGDATVLVADAQQAAHTRGISSFGSFPPGLQAVPVIYSPTHVLTSVTAPVKSPTQVQTPRATPDSPPPTQSPAPAPPPATSPTETHTATPPATPGSPPPPKSPAPPPTTPEPIPKPQLEVPQAPTPIPEPGSAALFGLGLAIVLLLRPTGTRRRKR